MKLLKYVTLGIAGGLIFVVIAFVLITPYLEANKELVNKQYELVDREEPDRIVYNGKAVYPIIWGLSHSGKTILVSPLPYMHYVRDHTDVAFNSNYGPFLNKLTYSLANFGVVTTVMITKKCLGLTRKITRKQVKEALVSNKAIYAISPLLFSRPDYWNEIISEIGAGPKGIKICL